MPSIKVISNGTAMGTKVLNSDGDPIGGITSINLHLAVDTLMTAKIEFCGVECEIIADWNNHPLKQWADKKVGRA